MTAPRRCAWALAWASALVGTISVAVAPPQAPGSAPQHNAEPQPSALRSIRFETREGTWMSVDVSPDGSTIVFDLVGHLYTLPIGGGRARAITAGPGFDSQPRFSPDGQQVAFVSDRSGIGNVWIVRRDGRAPRQISALKRNDAYRNWVSAPAWTPNGQAIVVSQRFGAATALKLTADQVEHWLRWLLAAYDVQTGVMRWVTDTSLASARQAHGPVVTPNGRTVFAAVEPHRSAYVGEARSWQVARIDLSSGAITPEVAASAGRWGVRPAISPNGRLLAYVSSSGSRMGLRLRDLETLNERWLVTEMIDVPSIWGPGVDDLAAGLAFTPDSKAIVIGLEGKLFRLDVRTGHRRQIPFVAEVQRELPHFTLHQFELSDSARPTHAVMQPALSPNGTRVAFTALGRIWIMELPADGRAAGPPHRLTADSAGESYPSWSPDGSWIVYSRWRDGRGGSINRAQVPSVSNPLPSESELLTADPAVYFNTAVAPDGQRVFALRAPLAEERILSHYGAHPPDSVDVVSLPAGGGQARAVASTTLPSSTHSDGSWAGADQQMARSPTEQLHFAAGELRVGLLSVHDEGLIHGRSWVIADSETVVRMLNDATGVLSPHGTRALVTHNWTLSEVSLPASPDIETDTFNVEEAQKREYGDPAGAAARWGRVLAPWISWSSDGTRVLFVQGGTFFVGTVRPNQWTHFVPVQVPLPVPVDVPEGALVLRHARVITMSAQGSGVGVIPRADVVIRNNRIAAVGSSGTVALPSGARELDMSGKTILPGYVDIHDHIQYSGGVHAGQCWACLVRLAYGVTAIRDPYAMQSDYNDIFSYQERERTGQLIGPRIFSTGIVHYQADRPIVTRDEADELVRPTAEYFGAETFKEYSDAPWTARRLVAEAASRAGLNATIHGDPFRAVLDGFSGLEHNFDKPLYADVLTLMAQSRITHTQTFGTTALGRLSVLIRGDELWKHDRMRKFVPPAVRASLSHAMSLGTESFGRPEGAHLRRLFHNAAGLVNRGGNVAIGSHGDVPGIGFHWELLFHRRGGMSNAQILRSATIVGATAIGHAKDLGSLEPGKLADLQILDKNPLESIHNTTSITYVMKNGRLYQAEDLTEIWPRHKPLPSIYLWDTKHPDSSASTPQAQPD